MLRSVVLVALAVAAVWFGVVENDWADPRPVQRLLYLGHSFTYYNNMPAMVAKMADSADSPTRYDITMNAFANATLEDHWHNRKTRRLLAQGGWDRVILQPERETGFGEASGSLHAYGTLLLSGTAADRPAIVISWMPTEAFSRERGSSASRSGQADALEGNLRGLADTTGADVIDIASIWDAVDAQGLPFSLYKDGNHPSLEGSYLAALVVYAGLTGGDVAKVSYVPWGMSSDDAELLRMKVKAALERGTDAGIR